MTVVLEHIEEGVATLTLNRPERKNALSVAVSDYLLEALPRLALDSCVQVIVLTGAGGAFCAGGDVKDIEANRGQLSEQDDFKRLRTKMEIARLLHEIAKPTIAMVRGAAAGAGMALAMACDLRIAAHSARFVPAFSRVGFSGDFGGSFFLTQLIGTAKARELYYTGATVVGEEAMALGLVNRLVPDDRLLEVTMALAREIAAGPSIAIGFMKRNMNLAEHGPLAQILDEEAHRMIQAARTDDHKEALRAIAEKRKPVFAGR